MSHHWNRLQRAAFERCIPLNVTFEITLRCNLRCVHCYNFDRELSYAPGKSLGDELSDSEIHRILDEIRAEGCLFLAFTGGEALLHPGLADFIRHACTAGMAVRLKTNGSLLTPRVTETIAQAGASAMDVSLYGADAATHDGFVKKQGAFAATLAGAERARDAGLEVRLTFVVVRQNADHIGAMMEAAESRGLACTLDPQLSARYDGSRSSLDHRVGRTDLERLFRGPLRRLLPPPDPGRDSVQCPCARSVCGVTAFGVVYPCIGAPLAAGDLRRRPFREIWRGSELFRWIRGLTLADFPACRSCEHLAYCPRSSGMVYANTGRYTGPSSFGEDGACFEAEVFHRLHDEFSPASPDGVRAAGSAAGCGAAEIAPQVDAT